MFRSSVSLFFILFISCVIDAEKSTYSSNFKQIQTQNDTNINRIVGGRIITIREAPYQVAVFRNREFCCGGSVISSLWVLTAAHCVYEDRRSTYMIRAGSDFFKNGGQVRGVVDIIINGGYNHDTKERDLAMMKLRKRLSFNQYVQPIKLASPILPIPRFYFVSGWGLQRSKGVGPTVRLRGVEVEAIKRSTCAQQYSEFQAITDNMICAASPGKDACQGDSGGPLVHGNIQYGVVSFGVDCARPDFFGIYVNLRTLSAWVYKVALKHRRRRILIYRYI